MQDKYTDFVAKPITLNNNGSKITGIVCRSLLGAFHEVITKDNKKTKIDYNQNSYEFNNYIFFTYMRN